MAPYEGSADDELDNPSGSLFMLTAYQKKIIRNLIALAEARGKIIQWEKDRDAIIEIGKDRSLTLVPSPSVLDKTKPYDR